MMRGTGSAAFMAVEEIAMATDSRPPQQGLEREEIAARSGQGRAKPGERMVEDSSRTSSAVVIARAGAQALRGPFHGRAGGLEPNRVAQRHRSDDETAGRARRGAHAYLEALNDRLAPRAA